MRVEGIDAQKPGMIRRTILLYELDSLIAAPSPFGKQERGRIEGGGEVCGSV
jgi:hypothetical protein